MQEVAFTLTYIQTVEIQLFLGWFFFFLTEPGYYKPQPVVPVNITFKRTFFSLISAELFLCLDAGEV